MKTAPKIGKVRSQIDLLDVRIVQLLNRRARLAQRICEIKSQAGLKIYDRYREAVILQNVKKLHKGPLHLRTLQAMYRLLLSDVRNQQSGRNLLGKKK